MSDIQPGSIPEHLSVEWRLAIDEGNCKPELIRIELTRGSNVGDKELRFGVKKCRFGQSFSEYIVHSVDCAPRSAEEQDVAVRVANLEPAKTVVGILEGHAKGCSTIGNSMFAKSMFGKALGKFDGERVRVWCMTKASHLMEGQRFGFGSGAVSLSDLTKICAPSRPNDGEKRVSIRLLESRLKAKLVAVKSDALIDVADDEER